MRELIEQLRRPRSRVRWKQRCEMIGHVGVSRGGGKLVFEAGGVTGWRDKIMEAQIQYQIASSSSPLPLPPPPPPQPPKI